jgi:hypothetical protein
VSNVLVGEGRVYARNADNCLIDQVVRSSLTRRLFLCDSKAALNDRSLETLMAERPLCGSHSTSRSRSERLQQ